LQVASQRANVDFRPLIDHISAVEYATKYASKAEKGSKALEKLISTALSRTSEQTDDTSARALFASFLVQQVGGRDWSAQEVGHVAMGFPTVFASHDFVHCSLSNERKLRDDLDPGGGDNQRADEPNKMEVYLRREHFLKRHYLVPSKRRSTGQQPTLHAYGVGGNVGATKGVDPDHVMRISFTDFWRSFCIVSAGPHGQQVKRRGSPTIACIKPRMPPSWGKRGHEKRADYCRVRLLSHRCFTSRFDLDSYVNSFGGDYEAAYEDFVVMDPDAPATCKGDFRELFLRRKESRLSRSIPPS
jgi:hypothetical protein